MVVAPRSASKSRMCRRRPTLSTSTSARTSPSTSPTLLPSPSPTRLTRRSGAGRVIDQVTSRANASQMVTPSTTRALSVAPQITTRGNAKFPSDPLCMGPGTTPSCARLTTNAAAGSTCSRWSPADGSANPTHHAVTWLESHPRAAPSPHVNTSPPFPDRLTA